MRIQPFSERPSGPDTSISLRLLHRIVLGVILPLLGAAAADADECTFPDNVDWVVDASCEISVNRIAPRNLSVVDGAALTIEESGELIIDMRRFRVRVDSDARFIVAPGGRVRSNQIGPLLVRGSDGGTFGYFLKRVGGPVLDTINPDLSFHPSSTIKALYMVEALRQVDQGPLTLAGTQLTLCPSPIIAAPAGTTTCPNSFQSNDETTGAGGAGGNCATGPAVANNNTNCEGPTVSLPLGVSICAMMKVSNNQTSNAIQETVGSGDPQTGWSNMITNAGSAIGLSATSFDNRMGCGGPVINMPNNQTTLRDLGLLYEQMATDPAVMFPSSSPATFVFPNTDAYDFMENHEDNGAFAAIVNEQATEIGLDATTIANFEDAVRFAQKAGSNGRNLCPANCPSYTSIAGWISLPVDGGAATRDYVYGAFINDVTTSSLASGLRPQVAEMLRPVIRGALKDF